MDAFVLSLEGKVEDASPRALANALRTLGLNCTEVDPGGSAIVAFRVERIPEPATLGRLADLGLEAAGLSAGAHVIHEFRGEIDMRAVRDYRRTHLRRRLQQ
jgi:hypothetical protein